MNTEQRSIVARALAPYGARLTDEGYIARAEKVFGVRIEVRKVRIRILALNGGLLASYPTTDIAAGVAKFVESFWYWKRALP